MAQKAKFGAFEAKHPYRNSWLSYQVLFTLKRNDQFVYEAPFPSLHYSILTTVSQNFDNFSHPSTVFLPIQNICSQDSACGTTHCCSCRSTQSVAAIKHGRADVAVICLILLRNSALASTAVQSDGIPWQIFGKGTNQTAETRRKP